MHSIATLAPEESHSDFLKIVWKDKSITIKVNTKAETFTPDPQRLIIPYFNWEHDDLIKHGAEQSPIDGTIIQKK